MENNEIEKIKSAIRDLIKKYESIKVSGKYSEMKEKNVASIFIEPLFGALGWDTKNYDEYEREETIREGYVDAVIKIGGEDAILIETKKFNGIHERSSESLMDDVVSLYKEEEQLLNNAKHHEKGIKHAILTNFEKFRLFDTFNNKIVLSIENPSQYLSPKYFDNFIKLHKRIFPNEEIKVEFKGGTELYELLQTIAHHRFNDEERRKILGTLNWIYITKDAGGYGNTEEYIKSVLYGLVNSGGTLTEKGRITGSQLVRHLIDKNKDKIINVVNSTPAKALKVILEYPQTTHLNTYPRNFSYPASHPEALVAAHLALDQLYISQHLRHVFQFQYSQLPLIEFVLAIERSVRSNIYFIFTKFEKSWEIGDTFFSNICTLGLGFIVSGSNTKKTTYWRDYVIPEELKDYILSNITDCNLDNEIRKILIASILATMSEPRESGLSVFYKSVQQQEFEKEIIVIVNNMANSGMTTKYYYLPGKPPFFVKDTQKYFEYIDVNIIIPVIESIIKK